MIAIFWIDWYAYHVARFRALAHHRALGENVAGVELVGGCGVHAGLRFREDDRAGLPITTLLPGQDWSRAGKIKLAKAVWSKLGQLHPRAVLVPGYYTAPALAAALWARLHRRRSILMTETARLDHPRVWWKEIPKRWMLRAFFDYAVCGGEPHARYLEALGFPPRKIARCYDVVDNDFYASQALESRRRPEHKHQLNLPDRYFLFVGRLAPEKNVAALVAAFADYRRRGGDWSLVLAGDGPEREPLTGLCRHFGIADAVIFAGLRKTHQVAVLYAFAGCLILPSIREPWGLVVNEAMAAGLAVLVSQRCGCAEDLVRQSENGFVFDPFNSGELARRLGQIAALPPDALRAMGEKSAEIIRSYSLDRWADEIARIAR